MPRELRKWLAGIGAQTLPIEPRSPWGNGSCKSFNSKLRNEFLTKDFFNLIKHLRVPAENWRIHYGNVGPHSSLGYKSPAPAQSECLIFLGNWALIPFQ